MKLEGKSLKRDFLRFILPAIGAQWVFALYTLVDGMFVARGVSETALAAVNIASPFMTGMFALALTFAVGTSTIVAILFGTKRYEKANQVFTQNIVVLVILSVIVTVSVLLNLDTFCKFLGASTQTLHYVKTYIATIAPFAVCFILSYSFEILVSTDGYPTLATAIVSIGVVVNFVLDYVFVIVLHRGIFGAAFATGISQTVVIVFYLRHFLGKKGTIHFAKFHFEWNLIWRQIRNGFPSGITELSAGIATFAFNQAILSYLNEEALVSYTIIAYVNSLLVVSMIGITQGCQPLISYYYGKQEKRICRKLFGYELVSVAVLSVLAVAFCFTTTEGIVRLFVSEKLAGLVSYSVNVFRIFGISFLLVGYNIVASGYFTAMEKSAAAVVVSMGRGFVVLIASLALLVFFFGGNGIWWAPVVSEAVCLCLSCILYRKMFGKFFVVWETSFPIQQNAPRDAHSRDKKISAEADHARRGKNVLLGRP